jgi:hypothetical protein
MYTARGTLDDWDVDWDDDVLMTAYNEFEQKKVAEEEFDDGGLGDDALLAGLDAFEDLIGGTDKLALGQVNALSLEVSVLSHVGNA